MVEEWTPTERIKKTSFLKVATQLAENNHFPERLTTAIVPALAPNKALKKPKTQISLLEKTSKTLHHPY